MPDLFKAKVRAECSLFFQWLVETCSGWHVGRVVLLGLRTRASSGYGTATARRTRRATLASIARLSTKVRRRRRSRVTVRILQTVRLLRIIAYLFEHRIDLFSRAFDGALFLLFHRGFLEGLLRFFLFGLAHLGRVVLVHEVQDVYFLEAPNEQILRELDSHPF